MAIRTSLNVSLTPELEQFVQERLATGRYQTASEVIREGLRLLEHQERDREAAHLSLKTKLKQAASQAERGEVVDGESYIDQLINKVKISKPAKRPKAS